MLQVKKMRDFPEDVGLSSDSARHAESEQAFLRELIEVLLPFPGGLRRWSIMRAIRLRRQKSGQEISLKLEDEIERVFRKSCAGEMYSKGNKSRCSREDALFYRPKEKAGEVWALNLNRARAWLTEQADVEFDAR